MGEPRKSLVDHWSFLEEELEKFQKIVAELEAIEIPQIKETEDDTTPTNSVSSLGSQNALEINLPINNQDSNNPVSTKPVFVPKESTDMVDEGAELNIRADEAAQDKDIPEKSPTAKPETARPEVPFRKPEIKPKPKIVPRSPQSIPVRPPTTFV